MLLVFLLLIFFAGLYLPFIALFLNIDHVFNSEIQDYVQAMTLRLGCKTEVFK